MPHHSCLPRKGALLACPRKGALSLEGSIERSPRRVRGVGGFVGRDFVEICVRGGAFKRACPARPEPREGSLVGPT